MNMIAGVVNSVYMAQLAEASSKAGKAVNIKKKKEGTIEDVKRIAAVNYTKNDVTKQKPPKYERVQTAILKTEDGRQIAMLPGCQMYRQINLDGTIEQTRIINPVKVRAAYLMDEN